MSPLIILLIAMVIVIGGILGLRLHAFLALILGALVVGLLTPKAAVQNNEELTEAIELVERNGTTALLAPSGKQSIIAGLGFLMLPQSNGTLAVIGEVIIDPEPKQVETIDGSAIPAGARVLHHTQRKAAMKAGTTSVAKRIAIGFGNTCMGIGILIAMAAIIGKCLMDSGAAERIVLGIRNALGEKRAPLAFVGAGFTLGIPVFFDTVFYLLMPLGKAMRVRTGKNYLLYVLTIICGGTMAHSLVPPTPGPLIAADALGVDIGVMMLGGLIVGIFTATSGYLYAHWANRRYDIPLRPSAELPMEELERMAKRDSRDLPGLLVSVLPILLPVILLGLGTTVTQLNKQMENPPDFVQGLKPIFDVLGDKNIALGLGAVAALLLLAMHGKRSRKQIAETVQSALASGGVIILITAAGGAFGYMLRGTGIAYTIKDMLPATQAGLIPLAFLVTLIIRTAQGSASVAMITAAGIIAPIVGSTELGFHSVYIALAIGCGSKPISWMNDSGFWVISKMSGLTEGEMLKTNTVMGIIMASVGLVVCLAGATLLPFA